MKVSQLIKPVPGKNIVSFLFVLKRTLTNLTDKTLRLRGGTGLISIINSCYHGHQCKDEAVKFIVLYYLLPLKQLYSYTKYLQDFMSNLRVATCCYKQDWHMQVRVR